MKKLSSGPSLEARGFLLALALTTSLGLAPVFAQTDYSWNSSTTTGSASLWNAAGSWTPGGGPPASADSVITPTLFGDINVNIATAQVTNWTYNSGNNQNVFANGGTPSTLTISGTLDKSGAGTLTFRNSSSNLSLSVGAISVSAGSLNLAGNATQGLASLSAGSASITGGTLLLNATSASITGAVTLDGTGTLGVANIVGGTRSVSVGSLSSASATSVVAANSFSGSASTGTLILTASSGTTTYAGIIRNGASTSTLAVTKNGDGTQIFSGNSNIYNGGTTVSAGTLLVNNASDSGTGTGAVIVAAGGTLGGTGFIAPSVVGSGISVASGGFIAPGASIESLNISLAGTSGIVDLTGGGDFKFELGTFNASIGSTASCPKKRKICLSIGDLVKLGVLGGLLPPAARGDISAFVIDLLPTVEIAHSVARAGSWMVISRDEMRGRGMRQKQTMAAPQMVRPWFPPKKASCISRFSGVGGGRGRLSG